MLTCLKTIFATGYKACTLCDRNRVHIASRIRIQVPSLRASARTQGRHDMRVSVRSPPYNEENACGVRTIVRLHVLYEFVFEEPDITKQKVTHERSVSNNTTTSNYHGKHA